MPSTATGLPPNFNERLRSALLWPWLVVLMLLSLLSAPWAQASVSQSVRLPNQEYTESSEDLTVKVLGGHVRINRSWVSGQWYLNPAWANLRFQPDPLGGVLAIDRAGSMYTRLAGGTDTDVYAFGPDNFIARQASGWRWYDRLGHSASFDVDGYILSYQDLAGVTVHFSYAGSGTLTAVLDHHKQPALTIETDDQGRVTQVSDARESGRTVRYGWTGSGVGSRLQTVTDLRGYTWRYAYNDNGYITQRTDPLGATIELTYMSNPANKGDRPGFGTGGGRGQSGGAALKPSGTTKVVGPQIARVASYKDEAGATTHYRVEWDRSRQQYGLFAAAPNGYQSKTTYGKDGLALQSERKKRSVDSATQERMTDARGQVTTYQYNSARQPVRIIHPDGSSERFSYDSQGRKTEHINTLGIISRWEYNAQGKETLHTEAVGQPEQRTTRSTYDSYGQLLTQTLGAGEGSGSDAITYTFAYDTYGNRIKTTDPLGHDTHWSYNSQGLPLTQTDALDQVSSYSYDAAGNLLSETNPLSHSTGYTYDARHRVTQISSPQGHRFQVQYDLGGRAIELRSPGQEAGQGTQFTYNSLGRIATVTQPGGSVLSLEYDTQGRVTKVTEPSGDAVVYAYGEAQSPLADLPISVTYPSHKETYQYNQRGWISAITQQLDEQQSRTYHFAYDAEGQLVSTTDPAGHSTLYQYDALKRLTMLTDSLAGESKQTWDAQDNVVALSNANKATHRFEFDTLGQLTQEHNPLGQTTTYHYDALGQLLQRIDADGRIVQYSYDAAGRLTGELFKHSTRPSEHITYTYNADDELIGYEHKNAQNQLISAATYQLDGLGRTLQTKQVYGKLDKSGTLEFVHKQAFDSEGNLLSLSYPDGGVQQYVYDKERLTHMTLPNGSQINFTDYQWYEPGTIQTPGSSKHIRYDALLRPIDIQVKNSAATDLAQRTYRYTPAGHVAEIVSEKGTTGYRYDALERLTGVSPELSLQVLGVPLEAYTYDAIGNRTSSAHQPGAWLYNDNGQLIQYPAVVPFAFNTSAVETRVRYSEHGQLTERNTDTYSERYQYDLSQRLSHYDKTAATEQSPSVQAQYRYNPWGQRIAKQVTVNGQTRTTYYINNDDSLLAEADSDGTLTTAYGFMPAYDATALAWSTDPLWQARVVNNALDDNNTDYHYLHTDHLYTPMLATDEAGGISWNAVRDAFGATAVLPGNRISMPLRLPGQYFDPERGEHYNLLRDYQPTTGRYLQTDPIGLAGGINQYGYAYANPLSYSDPTGEVPLVAVAWAYGRCVASCTAIDAVMGGMGMACTTLSNTAKNCAADCLNPFNWAGGKKFKAAKGPRKAASKSDDVIYVTEAGVALPPGPKHKIPDNYVQNPHRSGSYGELVDGKFNERLRIDPPTSPGQKGPNYSHYHKNGKGTHYSPRPGDKDPGF